MDDKKKKKYPNNLIANIFHSKKKVNIRFLDFDCVKKIIDFTIMGMFILKLFKKK